MSCSSFNTEGGGGSPPRTLGPLAFNCSGDRPSTQTQARGLLMFDKGDDGPSKACDFSIDSKKVKAFFFPTIATLT